MSFENHFKSKNFENKKKSLRLFFDRFWNTLKKHFLKQSPTDPSHSVSHAVPSGFFIPGTRNHCSQWGGKGKEGLRHSYDASFRHAIAKRSKANCKAIAKRSKANCKAKRSELQTPLTRRTVRRIPFVIRQIELSNSMCHMLFGIWKYHIPYHVHIIFSIFLYNIRVFTWAGTCNTCFGWFRKRNSRIDLNTDSGYIFNDFFLYFQFFDKMHLSSYFQLFSIIFVCSFGRGHQLHVLDDPRIVLDV